EAFGTELGFCHDREVLGSAQKMRCFTWRSTLPVSIAPAQLLWLRGEPVLASRSRHIRRRVRYWFPRGEPVLPRKFPKNGLVVAPWQRTRPFRSPRAARVRSRAAFASPATSRSPIAR